jgi:hypothetical protein
MDWRKLKALVDGWLDRFGNGAFGSDAFGSDAFGNEGFGSEGRVDDGFGSDRFGITGPRGSAQRLVPMLHSISEAGFCKHANLFTALMRTPNS